MRDMDDNKRFLLALGLSLLVAFIWIQYYMAPYQQQLDKRSSSPVSVSDQEMSKEPGSLNIEKQKEQSPLEVAGAVSQKVLHPTLADLKNSEHVTVESDKFILTINQLGGRLEKILLKGYALQLGHSELLDLVYSKPGSSLPLGLRFGSSSDSFIKYVFQLSNGEYAGNNANLSIPTGGELNLIGIGTLPDGRQIRKAFRFKNGTYLFEIDASLSAPEKDASSLWLEWSRFVSSADASERYNRKDFMLLNEAGKLVRVPGVKEKEGVQEAGKASWVSISDQHFMATLLPENPFSDVRIGREGDVLIAGIKGSETQGKFKVYAGPKIYEDLKELGYGLEKSVDLGWFSFLAYPILLLLRMFYALLGNYGLAIILLTLFIKIAFLPLTSASFRSMQAMQEIQPEVQALRERIEDPTKLNQELMALYKRRGVNPLGGCLPIAIQIPVFLGLYNALLNAIELRHAPFALWINDLSAPERLELFGVGVPLMILIMGVSMLIQQWTTPTAMDPAQKKAFMLMPVMFTVMFIVFPMPSGLVLYWLINNVISIVQQACLRKQSGIGPMQATIISSVAIFILGYFLVLI
ncbi:MAG: membrane protein insertase YidC [SAR324 cluster bacterium]|uniref:Membrane protein insertase YidC n=1 Tax=SAR324 cluster bacterium TaxID=2024889 RepID=A0A7X9IK88_9DELT|nr:membrane protein insertase YidC [SAR324 cluster bacterium]